VTSETPLQQLLRALVRFWWVALLGIVLAGLAFTFATYSVKLGMPPKLTARTQPTYNASTQMLVTSKRDPNLSSTNVNAKIVKLPDSTTSSTTGTPTSTQNSTYDSGSGADGDLQRLDEIANNLPPRVTSDPVVKLRNQMFGRISGSVTAANPYAFSGAGGFRSGPLPYIQINGTAGSPQDAVSITNQTAVAFKQWFEARQVSNHIPVANRVVVEQVNSADHASASGGSKPLLGVAAALLVLLGASGLALALDRLIPRRRRRAAAAASPERTLPATELTLPTPEPAMPALEVPTMTLGARVEDAITGEAAKPAPRPRKQSSNGASNGSAPKRRRATSTTPRVAPSSDDAS
jgi:capsular polysaccharide biosynthesis protein